MARRKYSSVVRRNPYMTPTSGSRRILNKVVRKAVGVVADASGFGGAYRAGRKVYKVARKLFQGKKQTVTTRKRKGYSGPSNLGGKFPSPYKKARPQKINGKWTAHGIRQHGITFNIEKRKSVSGQEAVAVGHTTMPGQIATMNCWRAVVKSLMVQIGCHLKDYAVLLTSQGFVAGDIFRFAYGGVSGDEVGGNYYDVVIDANTTFDSLAAIYCSHFTNLPVMLGIRPEKFEFIPYNSGILNSYSKWPYTIIQLDTAKVSVSSTSKLTIQNVTVEQPADNEADDVNSVPIVGRSIKTKGNNMLLKSNRKTLPGLFAIGSDDALFESYTKESGSTVTGKFYHYGTADGPQSTYFKPAEPPRDMDVHNLVGSSKVSLQPGQIKHSTIYNTFEMSFNSYFDLIYKNGTHIDGNPSDYPFYNPKLGTCETLVLEKAVGRKPIGDGSNDIKLWIQLQYTQSVFVHGKNRTYTLPIQMQIDFD